MLGGCKERRPRESGTCIDSAARSTGNSPRASWRTTGTRRVAATSSRCSTPARTRSAGSPSTAGTSRRPARSLFNEIQSPLLDPDQLLVWKVVEKNIRLGQRVPLPAARERRTRRTSAAVQCTHPQGTPCQRTPLPGRDYCPSHKHLEEALRGRGAAARELDGELEPAAPLPRAEEAQMREGPGPGRGLSRSGHSSSVPACCSASTSAGPSRTRSCSTAGRSTRPRRRRTPDDQSRGVIAAVEAALERAGAERARSRPSPTG